MKLDPRTKLFLAVAANGAIVAAPFPCNVAMVLLPAVLLLFEGRRRFVLAFLSAWGAAAFCFERLKPADVGTAGTLVVAAAMLLCRMAPVCVVLHYVATTTRMNEFLAGLSRMRVPDRVAIPLAVMIRFLPTVFEESRAIGQAMRMRGIRLFGPRTPKEPLLLLECRLVPLLVSVAKIGDELSIAAATRGLSPGTKRSGTARIGFRAPDFAVVGYCLVVLLASSGAVPLPAFPGPRP